MKFKNNFSFRKILDSKRIVSVISLVLAFAFWLIIAMSETPTINSVVNNIPFTLETEGTVVSELGLDEISGVTEQTVSVRVTGPAYVLNQISEADIAVTASLSEVTKPGEYQLELTASKKSFASEYTISEIVPAFITARFDYIDTKQFTITPKITGVIAVDGLEKGDPVVADVGSDTITVKGPRSEIQKIASVVALAEVNEVLGETKTYDANIILYDENNNELNRDKYTISTSTVKISQPILKSKTVPIRATFINAPAAYLANPVKTVLSINEINIAGPAESIDNINYIELSPINYNQISKSNNTFEIKLALPAGVKSVDSVETVNVKVDLSSFSEKRFTISKIVASGNKNNFSVELKSAIQNVKICGPSNIINSISANDLYAEVDMTDKNKGDYIVTVNIKSAKHQNIWQVGTYQATIKVK